MAAFAAVAVVGLIAAACSSTPSASKSPTTIARSPANSTSPTTNAATSQTVVNAVSNTTIGGTILVDTSGKTLYTLSADTGGMSSCSGVCATAWPPLTVPSGVTPKGGTGASGTFATITRSDGSHQVTVNGQPLYMFAGDSSAGSTSGNGIKSFGGTWSVVKVGAATPSSNTSSNTTAPLLPKTPATTPPTPTTTAASGGYSY